MEQASTFSGLASGLVNTSQQVGGSLGLAVLSGIAASATTRYIIHSGSPASQMTQAEAAVHGFHIGFLVAMVFALLASLIALIFIKQTKVSGKDLNKAMEAAG